MPPPTGWGNSESTVTVLPSIAVFFHGTYRGAQSVVPPNIKTDWLITWNWMDRTRDMNEQLSSLSFTVDAELGRFPFTRRHQTVTKRYDCRAGLHRVFHGTPCVVHASASTLLVATLAQFLWSIRSFSISFKHRLNCNVILYIFV